jgi:hypothetical protein
MQAVYKYLNLKSLLTLNALNYSVKIEIKVSSVVDDETN